MINEKLIIKENLFHNLKQFSNKRICAMVKANAYGHGLKEIVCLLDEQVDYFGVANEYEGKQVRNWTSKPILVVGKVKNYSLCRKHNLEIMIDDEISLMQAIREGLEDSLHLKVNCGMNRFGVNSTTNMKIISSLLVKYNVKLKSVFTHFSNTKNKRQTQKQYNKFLKLFSCLEQKPTICFGGSLIKNYPFNFDMIRVGIGLYGYEDKNLIPVMEIRSKVIKKFYMCCGEYLGYGHKYKVKRNGFYAAIPVGYADGLSRLLSGKFRVYINGKTYPSVGNICMDLFFVKIDEDVKVGDCVVIMQDANIFAKKLKTIPYEILTNFSNMRAKTKIV